MNYMKRKAPKCKHYHTADLQSTLLVLHCNFKMQSFLTSKKSRDGTYDNLLKDCCGFQQNVRVHTRTFKMMNNKSAGYLHNDQPEKLEVPCSPLVGGDLWLRLHVDVSTLLHWIQAPHLQANPWLRLDKSC
jgi:hypothetical protein